MRPPASQPVTQITSDRCPLEPKKGPLTVTELGPDGPAGGSGAACRGLYVHVPFCFHKCHYCDFYSIVDDERQGPFVDRLCGELEATAPWWSGGLVSIFVGGGTPTLLREHFWRRILDVLARVAGPADDVEFTVEANPETVEPALLDVLAAGGVNRLSIGAQSFHDAHLQTLERHHDPRRVRRAVRDARAAGIADVNLDLIFAIPGQSPAQWERDLGEALALEPTHLSCYGLMYEPNTPLTMRLRAGRVRRVDEDVEAAMYELAVDRLAAAGFEHYEISNWARPGRRCRHNELYWLNEAWWPIGPSASGHVGGWRWKNAPHLGRYLDSERLPPIEQVERLDEDGRVGEALMLGLRRLDGIAEAPLESMLARGRRGGQRRAAIEASVLAGLLERRAGSLRLTRRGLLLADTVVAALL